ncbi:EamA family transporter [Natrialba sp. PRR66]|uniref:EamA family transporter n=1 Tax=Natrialba sp. PRR66 TaxID=3098146 RepID=UPI002B1D5B56|nr:EamA family transporter [Natrialba sp. PRR66]
MGVRIVRGESFDIGAALLFGYVFSTDTDWRPRMRSDVVGGFTSGSLVIVVANVLFFTGQQLTRVSTAAVIYSLVPIVTAAFASSYCRRSGFPAPVSEALFWKQSMSSSWRIRLWRRCSTPESSASDLCCAVR